MNCNKCGFLLKEEDQVCPNCGEPLTALSHNEVVMQDVPEKVENTKEAENNLSRIQNIVRLVNDMALECKKITTDASKTTLEFNGTLYHVTKEEAYFINGIIRKNKLKNCLEIGVAQGGSSILILNRPSFVSFSPSKMLEFPALIK